MCRYCNYNLALHYLINNTVSLEKSIIPTIKNTFTVQPIREDVGTHEIAVDAIEPESEPEIDKPIDDLTVIEVSTTEETTSTFQVPDTAFNTELKGEVEYSAVLVGSEDEELPDWISLNSETGKFTFKAEYEEIGTYEIIVQATDRFGESASSIVSIEVVSQEGEDTLLVEDEKNPARNPDTKEDPTPQEIVPLPNLTIDDVQTTDSSVGRELIFTVSLDALSAEIVTVDYLTTDDTAIAGEDYIPVDGTVTFAPGETEKTITVNTTGTSYLDPDENFFINLSNANNATIEDDRGKGTIIPAYAGIRGGKRSQDPVTFSFFDEDLFGQGGYDGSTRESNAREPSEIVKANYRQIFEHLNTLVDRNFVEVEESESQLGNIRIVVSDGPDYAYAGGHIHLAGWAAASDAGINGFESGQGIYGYSTLLHELGHAIGMPHSFGKDFSVFDPEENSSNSVMSYTYPGSKPATFMAYDVKSLQERYGAAEYRPEDTVYEFLTVDNYMVDGEIEIDTTRRLKQTIWDSGGTDTFDFSGLEINDSGYRFDLNQSKYQTTQEGYQGASYSRNGTTYYVPNYGTSIAIDVDIENLINSSSDDLIIANSAANTFSGYGLGLTTGDDTLIDTDNLDTLDLSGFSFLDVAKTQTENDLKIELGLADSITIKDYFTTVEENRINILSDDIEALISDVSIVEGNNGLKTANFTFNLSQASSELIELDYTTVDGNAKAGSDYTTKTGTVTFNPGQTSKTIAIEVLGDTVGEADETFAVHLLGSYGQVIADAEGIITNDDGAAPLPTLTINDTSATNGNNAGKATFTVSLDRSHDTEITVDYTTVDNVAIAGEDYNASNGNLIFAPGETEKTIEVDIIGDSLSSRDEDFTIQLSNVSNNATISDSEGIGNIIDSTFKIGLADGTDTNLQLASYPPDLEKDPDNLPFDVSPDHTNLTIVGDGNGWKEIPLGEYIGTSEKPLNPYTVVEFDFKSTEEGKLHGIHFEGRDHHDFYGPWEEGRFFQLHGTGEFGVQDFNNYEDSLGEWKTYQIPVHQYFNTNNWRRFGEWVVFAHEGNSDDSNTQFRNLQLKELLPISVAGVTVNESDGVASFTLTIPEASTETITLDYTTADDTAIAGQDYTAASGTVTFAPGETSQTIDIAINDDNESEAEESFNLNLTNTSNAIAIDQEVTATIEDNENPLPIVSLADISLDESNTGTTTASLTLNLDKSWTESVTVDYATADNTAFAEEDYTAAEGTITFAPGETSKTIEIAVNGDVLNETDESFLINLDNAVNATVDNTPAEVTINNDDALPSINISDAGVLSSIPVRDGDGNIKNTTGLLFNLTLDVPSNQTIKVDYTTADGTAVAGEDYSTKDKTLTFQPGETEKKVFVGVTLDDTEEADETLYLNLTNPENVTIADNQAIGTIEETRSLSVSDIQVSEDGTEALFTVSLDKPSVQGVFVNYATADGTAKAGADYTSTSGRLAIKAGEASATIAVPLIDNNLTEEDETFFLNLTKPKYVLVEDTQGQGTILNDDAIPTENPGGIYQGLQLWLKANADVTTADDKIATWSDNSQGKIDLGQNTADNRPTLEANGLNYNPVISFDGSNDTLASIDTLPAGFATGDASIFLVSKSDRANQRSTILAATPDNTYKRLLIHLPYSGTTYFDRGNIHGSNGGRLSTSFEDSNTFQLWNFQTETGVGQSILRNGVEVASDDNTSESFDSAGKTLELSSLISADAFEGDIAEVIIFNQALSESDRNAVDSYLGIKYGFTLDQTTPTNYVTSDGSIIWNATTAGDYKHDIAGIAVDNGSELSQVQSRSSNEDSIVTLSSASNLEDGEALVWSNDNNSADASEVTITNGITHLNRQWQVQEIGEVGTVNLSFDISGLGFLTEDINKFSLLIDDDGDFSNAIIHNTGIDLNGNEISFTDVDLQNGDYFTLAVPDAKSPGGIKANLQMWLKADDGVTATNNDVTTWGDRSGQGNDFTELFSGTNPSLNSNGINFNPTIEFNDTSDRLGSSNIDNFPTTEITQFLVLQRQNPNRNEAYFSYASSGSSNDFLLENSGSNTAVIIDNRTRTVASSVDDDPVILGVDWQAGTGTGHLYNNGSSLEFTGLTSAITPGGTIVLGEEQDSQGGGFSSSQAFLGQIAENIIFDRVLTSQERQQVESYLGIKYGTTLAQTNPTNYLTSDGSIIWNATTAGDYKHDIAGIAVDSGSELNQVQSKSSNDDAIVTIANASNLENGEALIWSNDNQLTDAFSTVSTVGNYQKIARQWKIQETGEVGTVDISFNLSDLGYDTTNPDNFVLLIDDDGDFSNAEVSPINSTIDADTVTFTGIDLNQNDYFSLAVPQQGTPGNISNNLQVWLKADSGITTNNGTVSNWQDSSLSQRNYSQSTTTKQPVVTNNAINFNPAVTFDGLWHSGTEGDVLETDKKTYIEGSLFFVVNSNKNSGSLLTDNWFQYAFDLNYGIGGKVGVNYYSPGNAYPSNIDSPVNETAIVSFDKLDSSGIFNLGVEKDGVLATDSVDTENSNRSFVNRRLAPSFEGDIAEFILYDSILNATEEAKVRTYLGIKYGVTLDQTTPTNYIASDDTIFWNAVTAGDYKHDIAGIAVDSGSELNQVQSKSSNDDAIVTIANASNLENGEALIWSNDNGALDPANVTITNGITHLTRQWQVQETGEVGTVYLSFNLANLGYLTEDINQFSLLIDDDGDFSNATVHKTGKTLNGDEISFTDVNLQDGNYFTLAVPDTKAPGGIKSNLQLWLKADDGVTATNNDVTTWGDRSGKGRNYTPNDSNNQPTLDDNQFNFNPVLNFDGNDTLITSRENFTQGEVFFVIKGQDNGSSSSLLSDRSGYNTSALRFEQWNNTGKLGFTRRSIADYASQVDYPVNELSLVSFSSEENNNIYQIAVENDGNLTQDNLDIGASRPIPLEYLAQGFQGEIAEVVVYDAVLSETDRLKLRSNLAIKYGLSLDRNSNYISSDNSVWWNASKDDKYNHNITGIAKDDSSGLNQVQSRSSNADSIVTISNASNLDDGEALIWGSNQRTIQSSFLQLDGINDYAEIPDNDAIDFSQDQDFTIEVRVRTNGSTNNDAILEKWNQSGSYPFAIRYRNNKILATRYDGSNNPSVTSTSTINDGEFHHVAFVKEGNDLKLYIDGELEGTTTDTTTGTTTNNSPLYLGSRGGFTEFFNGDVDDVRIWNQAKSETEIKKHQGGIDPDSTGLVAYLPMENGAVDITANNHDATLQNEASIINSASHNLPRRIWQVQENNGDLGTVTVSFDLSELGYHYTNETQLEDFALLIGKDDSFSELTFHTTGRTINDNTITFTGVDFANGDYFTLFPRYNNPDLVKQGNSNNEQIRGSRNPDILNGNNGGDRLYGYAGDDILFGDNQNDLLKGGRGNDELSGGDGNDRLYGNNDNDILFGGNGRDILDGGAGDDFLDGGAESDRLIGNSGNDIFVIEGGDLVFDYLDDSDRLGLKLDNFGVTSISNIFNSLEFEQNNFLVTIRYDSEVLATIYEETVSNFTIEDFVSI